MYYSKSENAFYSEAIFGNKDNEGFSGPSDVIEITDDEHQRLLAGQAAGSVIIAGEDGSPTLADARSLMSDQQIAAQVRMQRDDLLDSSDWIVRRQADEQALGGPLTLSDDEFREWLTYRAALRNITAQPGFPSTIDWPKAPG